jgi:transposase-like protein
MGIKRFTINEFRAAYPDNDACLDKLFQLRYRNLVCPKCESDKPFTRVNNRRSYQCPSCSFQIYPTQGTVFEKSTTPLTHWFYAIFLQLRRHYTKHTQNTYLSKSELEIPTTMKGDCIKQRQINRSSLSN